MPACDKEQKEDKNRIQDQQQSSNGKNRQRGCKAIYKESIVRKQPLDNKGKPSNGKANRERFLKLKKQQINFSISQTELYREKGITREELEEYLAFAQNAMKQQNNSQQAGLLLGDNLENQIQRRALLLLQKNGYNISKAKFSIYHPSYAAFLRYKPQFSPMNDEEIADGLLRHREAAQLWSKGNELRWQKNLEGLLIGNASYQSVHYLIQEGQEQDFKAPEAILQKLETSRQLNDEIVQAQSRKCTWSEWSLLYQKTDMQFWTKHMKSLRANYINMKALINTGQIFQLQSKYEKLSLKELHLIVQQYKNLPLKEDTLDLLVVLSSAVQKLLDQIKPLMRVSKTRNTIGEKPDLLSAVRILAQIMQCPIFCDEFSAFEELVLPNMELKETGSMLIEDIAQNPLSGSSWKAKIERLIQELNDATFIIDLQESCNHLLAFYTLKETLESPYTKFSDLEDRLHEIEVTQATGLALDYLEKNADQIKEHINWYLFCQKLYVPRKAYSAQELCQNQDEILAALVSEKELSEIIDQAPNDRFLQDLNEHLKEQQVLHLLWKKKANDILKCNKEGSETADVAADIATIVQFINHGIQFNIYCNELQALIELLHQGLAWIQWINALTSQYPDRIQHTPMTFLANNSSQNEIEDANSQPLCLILLNAVLEKTLPSFCYVSNEYEQLLNRLLYTKQFYHQAQTIITNFIRVTSQIYDKQLFTGIDKDEMENRQEATQKDLKELLVRISMIQTKLSLLDLNKAQNESSISDQEAKDLSQDYCLPSMPTFNVKQPSQDYKTWQYILQYYNELLKCLQSIEQLVTQIPNTMIDTDTAQCLRQMLDLYSWTKAAAIVIESSIDTYLNQNHELHILQESLTTSLREALAQINVGWTSKDNSDYLSRIIQQREIQGQPLAEIAELLQQLKGTYIIKPLYSFLEALSDQCSKWSHQTQMILAILQVKRNNQTAILQKQITSYLEERKQNRKESILLDQRKQNECIELFLSLYEGMINEKSNPNDAALIYFIKVILIIHIAGIGITYGVEMDDLSFIIDLLQRLNGQEIHAKLLLNSIPQLSTAREFIKQYAACRVYLPLSFLFYRKIKIANQWQAMAQAVQDCYPSWQGVLNTDLFLPGLPYQAQRFSVKFDIDDLRIYTTMNNQEIDESEPILKADSGTFAKRRFYQNRERKDDNEYADSQAKVKQMPEQSQERDEQEQNLSEHHTGSRRSRFRMSKYIPSIFDTKPFAKSIRRRHLLPSDGLFREKMGRISKINEIRSPKLTRIPRKRATVDDTNTQQKHSLRILQRTSRSFLGDLQSSRNSDDSIDKENQTPPNSIGPIPQEVFDDRFKEKYSLARPQVLDLDQRLYCNCRQRAQAGMVACDNCDDWYHYECLGLKQSVAKHIDRWICFACNLILGNESSDLLCTADSSINEPIQAIGKSAMLQYNRLSAQLFSFLATKGSTLGISIKNVTFMLELQEQIKEWETMVRWQLTVGSDVDQIINQQKLNSLNTVDILEKSPSQERDEHISNLIKAYINFPVNMSIVKDLLLLAQRRQIARFYVQNNIKDGIKSVSKFQIGQYHNLKQITQDEDMTLRQLYYEITDPNLIKAQSKDVSKETNVEDDKPIVQRQKEFSDSQIRSNDPHDKDLEKQKLDSSKGVRSQQSYAQVKLWTNLTAKILRGKLRTEVTLQDLDLQIERHENLLFPNPRLLDALKDLRTTIMMWDQAAGKLCMDYRKNGSRNQSIARNVVIHEQQNNDNDQLPVNEAVSVDLQTEPQSFQSLWKRFISLESQRTGLRHIRTRNSTKFAALYIDCEFKIKNSSSGELQSLASTQLQNPSFLSPVTSLGDDPSKAVKLSLDIEPKEQQSLTNGQALNTQTAQTNERKTGSSFKPTTEYKSNIQSTVKNGIAQLSQEQWPIPQSSPIVPQVVTASSDAQIEVIDYDGEYRPLIGETVESAPIQQENVDKRQEIDKNILTSKQIDDIINVDTWYEEVAQKEALQFSLSFDPDDV